MSRQGLSAYGSSFFALSEVEPPEDDDPPPEDDDPPPEAPEIDFANEMVVVAAMGTRPSGGYAIRIDRVARRGNTVWVEVTSSAPGSGCMTTASLTAPVDLVVTQRMTGKVVFVEKSEVRNC